MFLACLCHWLPGSAFLWRVPPLTPEAKEPEEKPKKTIIYDVELVETASRELHAYVLGTATLKADKQVDIYSKVAGQVGTLAVEEGTRVEKNALLVGLDDREHQLRLAQAQVNLDKASREFTRIEKSFKKELVSADAFDVKKFAMDQARADYDLAAYELEKTRVIAPFNGTVITREIEPGQTIQPSEKLLTLASLDHLEADVFLPEAQVVDLQPGLTVTIARDDSFKETFTGTLERISTSCG